MKRILTIFSLVLVSSLSLSGFAKADLDELELPPTPVPVEINSDHHFELSIPEDQADQLEVYFTQEGMESSLELENLLASTLELSYFQETLINENIIKTMIDIPFSVRRDGDAFVIKLKDPEIFGIYKSELTANTPEDDSKSILLDLESEISLEAPNASLSLVHEPSDENEVADEAIEITEKSKSFISDGKAQFRFIVVPSDDQDGGQGDDNNDGDNNDQNNPAPSSGGCSFLTAGGSSNSLGMVFGFALLAMGVLRTRTTNKA